MKLTFTLHTGLLTAKYEIELDDILVQATAKNP
jgi:hypothetical protein